MANAEHVERLKQGRAIWNTWREEHREVIWPDLREADLNRADLSETRLHGADLVRASLSKANLSGASLTGADLRAADLSGANLTGAYLIEANLSGTDLSGADLRGTNLYVADLREADLKGADLREAELFSTIFARIDLRTVKGLATIHHHGPSNIELFSVQLPHDGSALHFLRGVGVPDEWIDDYRAHMMHPIQYHSCFISYCSKDEMLAKRLHADLQDVGVRCWFAPEDMKIGDRIRTKINEAIHLQDKLLLLLSEQSVNSAWVEAEVKMALAKERREQRDVLFPVRLDESVLRTEQPWAKQLRLSRHIGDFTLWTNPEVYKVALERLLRDLKQG